MTIQYWTRLEQMQRLPSNCMWSSTEGWSSWQLGDHESFNVAEPRVWDWMWAHGGGWGGVEEKIAGCGCVSSLLLSFFYTKIWPFLLFCISFDSVGIAQCSVPLQWQWWMMTCGSTGVLTEVWGHLYPEKERQSGAKNTFAFRVFTAGLASGGVLCQHQAFCAVFVLCIALNLLAAFLIVFASACLSPPPPTSTPGGGGALSGFRWLCLCCGCMITVEPTVAFGAEAPESRPCLLLAGPVIRGKSHNLFEV
jgi:hypothetical protein